MILSYERARDTLSIIEGFCNVLDDCDPPALEVVYNDSLDTIVVLVQGLTYMMQVGSDDDAYCFHLMTDDQDEAIPRSVIVPFREIAELKWEKAD